MKEKGKITGAEVLIKYMINSGINICFANAGTTELPILAAIDKLGGIKPVLCLFEGVCTGAADGYGRLTGRPAMTLLHMGPGFSNGIANLHNARRARSPVFNIIGDHATWHRSSDPPLAMDIESLSATVSDWTCMNRSVSDLPLNVANGISIASGGRIATLIVPHDHLVDKYKSDGSGTIERSFNPIDEGQVRKAADFLKGHKRTAILLGPWSLRIDGIKIAGEIQSITGCDLFAEAFPNIIERGVGLPDIKRIPYFPEAAVELLSKYEGVVIAGTREPMAFFGYPGGVSKIMREDQIKVAIGSGKQNVIDAMALLLDLLKCGKKVEGKGRKQSEIRRPELPNGDLDAVKVCQILAAIQPEGAIIVDEGLTTSMKYYNLTESLPPHTILFITGGSIGYGMPCAIGAALACPDRPVINFQADGSAMYTVQALWTQAREKLNITTLICSNRSYEILKIELDRAGIKSPGVNTKSVIELTEPDINWVRIAEGLGVPGISVTRCHELADVLKQSIKETGPFLIEIVL